MSSKPSAMKPAPSSPASTTSTARLAPDIGLEQLMMATDMSCAMLRGFEAIGKVQQDAAHEAVRRYEVTARRLHISGKPQDLLALQAELFRCDLQEATRYWQNLGAAALEMQTEIWGCARDLIDAGALLESASALKGLYKLPGMNVLFERRTQANARDGQSG